MSQQESAPYKRHIQIGCALFILVLAVGSYFTWMRMRRLYSFNLPPETQIYQIKPGQEIGDVTVDFAVPEARADWFGSREYQFFKQILALNPGDGTPIIESKKMSRQDSDKVLRVTYSDTVGYYTLVIDRDQ